MSETLTVNGTDLSTLVSNVESLTGMVKTPQVRNELVVVPAIHGRVGRQVPLFDTGEVTWPMWVVGADSVTGADLRGDPGVVAYYAAARNLVRLFSDPVLQLQHAVTGQPTLVATAQISDSPLDFTRQFGSPLFGRVVVTLDVPGAFWETLAAIDAGPFTVATGTSTTLTGFAGADAPMDELVFTVGPCNNPSWTQASTGLFLAYDGVVPAGCKLVLDTSTWRLNQVSGAAGVSGSTVWAYDERKVRYHPALARWFQLQPAVTGPVVRFDHTGGGTASWAVSGKAKYQFG